MMYYVMWLQYLVNLGALFLLKEFGSNSLLCMNYFETFLGASHYA